MSKKKPVRTTLATKLVAASVIGVCVYFLFFTPQKRVVRKHLSDADAKSKEAIDERLKPLTALFAKARKGAPGFAQAAMSWSGKWALVKGIADGESHKTFLAEEFARYVFTPDELRGAVEGACVTYADDLNGIENQMLVGLRADLADLDNSGTTVPPHLKSNEAFHRAYDALAVKLVSQTRSDLAIGAGREVAIAVGSTAAMKVAVQAIEAAAAEMGVEATILGVGASSAIGTLFIGTVIALIFDYVLDAILKMVGHDPEAKIAKVVVESLDKLEAALTRDPGLKGYIGMGTKGALRVEMEKLHKERSKIRRDTVALILKQGEEK